MRIQITAKTEMQITEVQKKKNTNTEIQKNTEVHTYKLQDYKTTSYTRGHMVC